MHPTLNSTIPYTPPYYAPELPPAMHSAMPYPRTSTMLSKRHPTMSSTACLPLLRPTGSTSFSPVAPMVYYGSCPGALLGAFWCIVVFCGISWYMTHSLVHSDVWWCTGWCSYPLPCPLLPRAVSHTSPPHQPVRVLAPDLARVHLTLSCVWIAFFSSYKVPLRLSHTSPPSQQPVRVLAPDLAQVHLAIYHCTSLGGPDFY